MAMVSGDDVTVEGFTADDVTGDDVTVGDADDVILLVVVFLVEFYFRW